jgi:transcriptional regulator with XRE-family HTH domain
MSGVELGRLLGVRQTQVSRYETGDNVPSDGVLLTLLRLADGEPEELTFRNALYARMGADPVRPMKDYLEELERYKEGLDVQGIPLDITTSNAKRAFIAEVNIILSDEQLLDPIFVEAVRYWRVLGRDPETQRTFAGLCSYLEMNFASIRERLRRARRA